MNSIILQIQEFNNFQPQKHKKIPQRCIIIKLLKNSNKNEGLKSRQYKGGGDNLLLD